MTPRETLQELKEELNGFREQVDASNARTSITLCEYVDRLAELMLELIAALEARDDVA